MLQIRKFVIIAALFGICLSSKLFAVDSAAEKIEFGKNLMMMRDFTKAIQKFDEILTKDPKHPDALFNKSLCNYNLFEYESSLKDLNKLAGIVPDVSDVYNLRGLVHMALKDTNSALNDFNKAIILDKSFTEAYLNRGKALIHFGKNEDAIKDLTKAISLDSNVGDMYYTKARAEHNLGLYRMAVEDFTTAMKNNYINSDIFFRRANSFFKDKDFANAIMDYTQVIYWEPFNALAYNNRAFAFDSTNDFERAQQDRNMVKDLEIGLSLEVENAKYKIFSNLDSNFTILMPDDFRITDSSNSKGIHCIFFMEGDTTVNKRLKVELKITPFYSDFVGSKEPAEIIESYRMAQDSLGTGYFRFELNERVTKAYKSYPSLLDKILVQKELKGITHFIWNYGIAYGEHLIEIHFTMPLPFYHYYSEVFAKSIESFVVRKI